MSLKMIRTFFTIALAIIPLLTHADLPEKGILPNEASAIKLAETILVNIYGEKVLNERPFVAKVSGDYWIIDGTLHCLQGSICKGGTAHIELNRKDGAVKNVIHGK